MMEIHTPLTEQVLSQLRAGDEVEITGTIYSARDAAHRRLMATLEQGEKLPFDLEGEIIYYVGPTPPRPGQVIGAAGPTTSLRMDPYTAPLLAKGLKAVMGKGSRGSEVREALKKYKAIYLMAVGGAGALLSKQIKKAEVVAYEDLGTEAIRRLEVDRFPAIVANDIHGGDLFEEGKAKYRKG